MKSFKQYLKEELESNLDFKRFNVRRFYEGRVNQKRPKLEAAGMVSFDEDRFVDIPPGIFGQPEIIEYKRYSDDVQGSYSLYWGLEFADGIKAVMAFRAFGILPLNIASINRNDYHILLVAGTEGKEEEIMQRIKDLIKIKKYKLNKDSENMFGNILRSV